MKEKEQKQGGIKNDDGGDDNNGKSYWDKGASLKAVLIFRPRLP